MFSQIFRLDWRDLVKGLIVVGLGAIIYGLIQLLPTFGLNPVVQAFFSALLAYLAKNLATDENGKLGGKI